MGEREQRLADMGATFREQADALCEKTAPLDQARARFLAVRPRAPRALLRAMRGWVMPAALAATAAFVLAFSSWHWLGSRTRTVVVLAPTSDNQNEPFVQASDGSTVIRFWEGSKIDLDQGASAVVENTYEKTNDDHGAGAQVRLLNGRARASIVHRPGTHWTIVAGPYMVRVTGTRFQLSWDKPRRQFAIKLEEGAVVVSGGCLSTERPVATGESLMLSCDPGETAQRAAAPSASVAPEPTIDASADRGAGKHAQRSNRAPSEDPKVDWDTLARAGDFGAALRSATRLGFAHECQTRETAAVMRLGDAARLSGDTKDAALAFLAVRRRAVHEPRAALAAFALGRMALDQKADPEDAASWFRVYLNERPNGEVREEALGRLVEAEMRAGHREAARMHAEQYLAAYPQGAYAPLSRLQMKNR